MTDLAVSPVEQPAPPGDPTRPPRIASHRRRWLRALTRGGGLVGVILVGIVIVLGLAP